MQLHISIGRQSNPELEGGAGRGEGERLSVKRSIKDRKRNKILHGSVVTLECVKDLRYNFNEHQ